MTQPTTPVIFDVQKDFGINKAEFLGFLRPTFSVLHLDPYDAKRAKVEFLRKRFPEYRLRLREFLAKYYADQEDLDAILDIVRRLPEKELREFDRIGITGRRKRAIARFLVSHTGQMSPALHDAWHITRVSAADFTQKVAGRNDARKLVRRFDEIPLFVTEYEPIQTIIRHLATMVRHRRPYAQVIQVNMHQVFIFADVLGAGDNAPEGIHRDGADFIVSALVIERAGIVGGESVVYARDKKTELLRKVIQPGQGIFQDDRKLWHDVTPIKEDPRVPPEYGHRSILGFDMLVVR